MRSRNPQSGATLLMVIGVTAVLAILAATLVMVTANTQGRTQADRSKTKAFNAAEAAMDLAMYQIGMNWPSGGTISWDAASFKTAFLGTTSASEYPSLVSSVTTTPGSDADHLWIVAQAKVGDQTAAIKTEISKQSIGVQTLAPGVAVYAGGDVSLTGSASVTGPTQNGQPTAALYSGGKIITDGGNPSITAFTYAKNGLQKANWQTFTLTGTTVPPMDQFFPSSLVQTLTSASQAAPNSGTLISNSTPGFSWPWGVNFSGPCYTTSDLHVNTQGVYNFGTLYVKGNLVIDGNATMNCTALYVTGNLTVGGGANTQSFGPTYVGGDVSFTGNQRFDIPLLVSNGNVTIANSQIVGGTGVPGQPKPTMLLMTGTTKNFNYSGNCAFTGVVANLAGGTSEINVSGSNAIVGAAFANGPVKLSGTGAVRYDPTVVNSFTSSVTTSAKIVPNTWQEITPTL